MYKLLRIDQIWRVDINIFIIICCHIRSVFKGLRMKANCEKYSQKSPTEVWTGVLPHCLKYGDEIILIAVVELGCEMFSEGTIPEQLKGTWGSPEWKGKDE